MENEKRSRALLKLTKYKRTEDKRRNGGFRTGKKSFFEEISEWGIKNTGLQIVRDLPE
jgi:hypothetical protein